MTAFDAHAHLYALARRAAATLSSVDADEETLRRIADGDEAAVRALVARKLPRLLALANRTLGDAGEAQDVAQEVFVRVWRHARAWRSGRARFDTWLFRVTLNLCYDRLRRRRETTMARLPERIDPRLAADGVMIATERGRQIALAVAALPTRQRDAIVLQYDRELSNMDAAAILGVSVAAFESLLARARRTLKAQLMEGGDE